MHEPERERSIEEIGNANATPRGCAVTALIVLAMFPAVALAMLGLSRAEQHLVDVDEKPSAAR